MMRGVRPVLMRLTEVDDTIQETPSFPLILVTEREPSVFHCTPLGPRLRGDDDKLNASVIDSETLKTMLSPATSHRLDRRR